MTHEHIGNTAMVDAAKGEVPRSTRFQPADRLRGEKRQVMDEEAAPRALSLGSHHPAWSSGWAKTAQRVLHQL